MKYLIEAVETKNKIEGTKDVILECIRLRALFTSKISIHDVKGYVVVNKDNVGVYMEEANDNLFNLYKEIYNIIKDRCIYPESESYFRGCAKIVPSIEITETQPDNNLKVYNIDNIDDIFDVKAGSEINLKNKIFIPKIYDEDEDDNDKYADEKFSSGFDMINKILSFDASTVVTTGEMINLFSIKKLDIKDDANVFVSLNYVSNEVNVLYEKYKKIGV